MTGTIRFRITVLSSAAVLGVPVVAGVGLVQSQRRFLTANLDGILTEQAEAIATLVERGAVPAILTSLGDDDTIGQVVTADGRVVASTANIEGEGPVAVPPPGTTISRRTVSGFPHDPARFRLLSRPVARTDPGVVIHVAGNLDEIEDSAGVLRRSLLVAVPALSGLLAGIIWLLVGRTLRPVEAIRVEVAGIGGAGLQRRVPVPAGDDEIARLAHTMNTMLERIEDSTGRQARFVADASHELRSPLTRIRSELEVDLAHPARADLAATERRAQPRSAPPLVQALFRHIRIVEPGAQSVTRPVSGSIAICALKPSRLK